MTTPPIQRRRTFLIGKAKPTAVIGKNREPGEIFLIIAGAGLGLLWGRPRRTSPTGGGLHAGR